MRPRPASATRSSATSTNGHAWRDRAHAARARGRPAERGRLGPPGGRRPVRARRAHGADRPPGAGPGHPARRAGRRALRDRRERPGRRTLYQEARELWLSLDDRTEAAAVAPAIAAARHLLGADLTERTDLLRRGRGRRRRPRRAGAHRVGAGGGVHAGPPARRVDRARVPCAGPRRRARRPGHGPRRRRDPGLGAGLRRAGRRGLAAARTGRPRRVVERLRGRRRTRLPDDRLVGLGARRVRPGSALAGRRHRLRRAGRAVERPPLHDRAPRPRPLGDRRLVGRGHGGPLRAARRRPRPDHTDHDPARARVPRDGAGRPHDGPRAARRGAGARRADA